MEKLKISSVLVKNADVKPVRLESSSVQKVVDKTQQQQNEILKFKIVDQDTLKRIIQF